MEFWPALVVDGEPAVENYEAFNGIQPRACIGQSEKKEILMLVIEGRMPTRSYGTTIETCTDILMRHKAYQALNLDGGTSAVLWYDGEYVTKCSNTSITSRMLPNAWLYGGDGRPIIFWVPFCCMPRACSSFFGFCGICPGKPCRMAAFCPEACRNPR